MIKACVVCGKEFEVGKGSNRAKTCSSACLRIRKHARAMERYHNDPDYRKRRLEFGRKQRKKPGCREKERTRHSDRMKDPARRAQVKERDRKYHQRDDVKERKRKRHLQRYKIDPDYRKRCLEGSNASYHKDPQNRVRSADLARKRYKKKEVAERNRKRCREWCRKSAQDKYAQNLSQIVTIAKESLSE